MKKIDEKSFIANDKVKLASKENFISWCDIFWIQCNMYNLKINKTEHIKSFKFGDIPHLSKRQHVNNDVEVYIGKILLIKLSKEEIISTQFKETKKLLSIVKNSFDFLDVFLR